MFVIIDRLSKTELFYKRRLHVSIVTVHRLSTTTVFHKRLHASLLLMFSQGFRWVDPFRLPGWVQLQSLVKLVYIDNGCCQLVGKPLASKIFIILLRLIVSMLFEALCLDGLYTRFTKLCETYEYRVIFRSNAFD